MKILPLAKNQTFHLILRSVLWALILLPLAGFVFPFVVPGKPLGALIATRDISRGHYELKTFGYPAPWRKQYAKLLSERYGIRLKPIAACVVSTFDISYSDGYNSLQLREIVRKFGYDVTKECNAEAQAEWKRNQSNPEPPDASFEKTKTSLVRIAIADFTAQNEPSRTKPDFQSQEIEAAKSEKVQIRKKLEQTILPKVDFRDVTLKEALNSLSLETQIPIICLSDHLPGERINGIEPGDARITLSLQNISASEALRYVTTLAGTVAKVTAGAIVVKPIICAGSALVPGQFKAPSTVEGTPLKDFLESKGVDFPPIGSFHHDGTTGCLTVRNSDENLKRITIILDELASTSKGRKSNQEITDEVELWWSFEQRQSLENRAVLYAEIHNVSLADIISELQSKLYLWVGTSVNTQDHIDLSTEKVSSAKLLQQIAELTKTRLIIDAEAVLFVPKPTSLHSAPPNPILPNPQNPGNL